MPEMNMLETASDARIDNKCNSNNRNKDSTKNVVADDSEMLGDNEDDATKEKKRCAGCREEITDRYLLSVVDKQWHLTCLVCSACKLPLNPEVTCFAKDDEIFCKEDYYRKFASRLCSCCQCTIAADELVMRVGDHIFHLHCFVCSVCSKQLTTGEHFGYNSLENLLFCRLHYEVYHMQVDDEPPSIHSEDHYLHEAPQSPILSPQHPMHLHPINMNHVDFSPHSSQRHLLSLPIDRNIPMYGSPLCCEAANPTTGVCYLHPFSGMPQQHINPSGHQGGSLQKGRPRKRKNVMTDVEHFVPNIGSEMGQEEAMLQHQRQKRMRTSFKHHQLRIMKSYFALNHNPDSKDLKQLAQKTGLSKRVLQVWFQNARAKHRRTAIKDRDKQQPSNQHHPQLEVKNDKSSLGDQIGDSCAMLTSPGMPMKTTMGENRPHHHQPLIATQAGDKSTSSVPYTKLPNSSLQNHFGGHQHPYLHERCDSNRPPSALSDVSTSSLMGFRSSLLHDECPVSNFADIFASSLKQMSSC